MKSLHKNNFYCWSDFDEDRNIDFHSYLWVREAGNIAFDPLPLSIHDRNHLDSLGTLSAIVISNSDHIRDAEKLAEETGAEVWGPSAEKENFPLKCSKWLSECKEVVEGLDVYCMSGSKTEGELAFIIEKDTLISGDLIRAHRGGSLCMLPDTKLKDIGMAKASVKRLASMSGMAAILPGDGWPVFRDGERVLSELLVSIEG